MKTDIQKQCEEAQYALYDLQMFFIKARTKLTLFETISKAQIKIRKIDDMVAKIGPGIKLEEIRIVRRKLPTMKKYVSALSNVQKRCEEVFGDPNAAEAWLKSKVIALRGKTPLEMMETDTGVDLVLTELGRIEHGIVS